MESTSGLLVLFLLAVLKIRVTEAKVFSICEVEAEVSKNVAQKDTGSWICLAKALSSLNSSLLTPVFNSTSKGGETIAAWNYGIFQISDRTWCAKEDTKILESGCKISCESLLDDDIQDDIACALEIANNEGKGGETSFEHDLKLCKGISEIIASSCRLQRATQATASPRIINLKNGDIKTIVSSTEPGLINCQANGDPAPQLRWEYNETEFPDLNSVLTLKGLVLVFPDANSSIDGQFTCVATNAAGSDSVTITVKSTDSPMQMSAGGFLFGFIAGLVLSVFIMCLTYGIVQCRRISVTKERVKEARGLTKEEIDEFRNGDPDGLVFNAFAHENARFQAYNNDYEIMDDQLIIETDKLLGSGAFGMVYRGWKGGREVAVKTIKPTADKLYIKALLSELKVMIYIGKHENIVNLIGAKTRDLHTGSLHIIVEFCALGSLESFIRQNKHGFVGVGGGEEPESHYANVMESNEDRNYANIHQTAFSNHDLLVWSVQIAAGMKYLASKKVIHGDLATRNILLSDKNHLKITDFGLSRQLYDYTNYVKKQQAPLPWRWMAIEALRSMTFSPQSDVWSFAVTLWEIFTLGEVPYAGLSWTLDFVNQLENGLRLLKPKHCSDDLYQKLLDCWKHVPSHRPDINFMHSFLENLVGDVI